MFERKNRGVLSEQYNKLVDHTSEASGSDEDFITLKRADHDIPSTLSNSPSYRRKCIKTSATSDEKQKGGNSSSVEAPTHLIFDDDGVAREAIEMKAVEEIFGAGDAKRVALEAGRTFGEKEC